MKSFCKLIAVIGSFLTFSLLSAAEIPFSERMNGIEPTVQKHLLKVLADFPKTQTGSFILKHISPNVNFRTKAMAQLGTADSRNTITLEALRLENKVMPDKTERQTKIKTCFTAEILAHELLHNAQFQAGLFQYPASFSGFAAVLCERLIEIQAKYTGETMFNEMRLLPEYKGSVSPKPGLFLVISRQSGMPAKDYVLTLWQNERKMSDGKPLFREQVREVSFWNRYYAEQAFRNNYRRFLSGPDSVSEHEISAHLDKILRFTAIPLTGTLLLQKSPVKPIPHGIACFENGKKVLELIAYQGGYIKKTYNGKLVNERKIQVKP